MPFDQRATHATPTQLQRQRDAHRPAADDDYLITL
jgi:hypothetical protein